MDVMRFARQPIARRPESATARLSMPKAALTGYNVMFRCQRNSSSNRFNR